MFTMFLNFCIYVRFFVSFWFLTTTPSDFPCIWPQTTCVSMKSFTISSWSLPARTMVMHPPNEAGICLPSSFHGKCSGVLVSMAFSALTWTNSVTKKHKISFYIKYPADKFWTNCEKTTIPQTPASKQ